MIMMRKGHDESPGMLTCLLQAVSSDLGDRSLGDWILGDRSFGDWILGDWTLGDWILGDLQNKYLAVDLKLA